MKSILFCTLLFSAGATAAQGDFSKGSVTSEKINAST
jgi:hypothetical protein